MDHGKPRPRKTFTCVCGSVRRRDPPPKETTRVYTPHRTAFDPVTFPTAASALSSTGALLGALLRARSRTAGDERWLVHERRRRSAVDRFRNRSGFMAAIADVVDASTSAPETARAAGGNWAALKARINAGTSKVAKAKAAERRAMEDVARAREEGGAQ